LLRTATVATAAAAVAAVAVLLLQLLVRRLGWCSPHHSVIFRSVRHRRHWSWGDDDCAAMRQQVDAQVFAAAGPYDR
jgi:hypothetical protein